MILQQIKETRKEATKMIAYLPIFYEFAKLHPNMGLVKFPRRGSNLVFKGGTKFKKDPKGGLKKSKWGIGTFFWGPKIFQLGDKKFSKSGIQIQKFQRGD